MAIATNRSGTVDHHTSPLSRDYSAIYTYELGGISESNNGHTKIEQVEGIILPLIGDYLATSIGVTTPDQKNATDEGASVADTWAGDLAAGL